MLVRHDTDLYDLTIKSRGRTEVIHTTSNHLFWATCRQVDPGRQTPPGEPLKPANGTTALADGGTTPKIRGRTGAPGRCRCSWWRCWQCGGR